MKPLCVVIPSRTASNLVASIAAVRQHEPDARIIVVDDGVDWEMAPHLQWGTLGATFALPDMLSTLPLRIIKGEKPFIFARNANIGIRAAGDADVVLLNDDALLESPLGFSLMQKAAEDHPEVGIIGAVTNVTGASHQQMRRNGNGFRIVDHIAFVCVLIPNRTREKLANIADYVTDDAVETDERFTGGYLDERYVTYGWEDNDYIRQCKTAGLQIAVHDGCYVNHSSLPSTFRGKGIADIEPGRKIYMAKWPGFRQ
jgi:hypothetical protein